MANQPEINPNLCNVSGSVTSNQLILYPLAITFTEKPCRGLDSVKPFQKHLGTKVVDPSLQAKLFKANFVNMDDISLWGEIKIELKWPIPVDPVFDDKGTTFPVESTTVPSPEPRMFPFKTFGTQIKEIGLRLIFHREKALQPF